MKAWNLFLNTLAYGTCNGYLQLQCKFKSWFFTPQQQYAYSLYCFQHSHRMYISKGALTKSFFNNQELLYLVIISFNSCVHNGWFWDEHWKEKLDTSHFKGVKGRTVLIQVSFTLPNLDCPTYSHSQLFVHHPSKPGIIEHSYTMLSTVSETKYYQI